VKLCVFILYLRGQTAETLSIAIGQVVSERSESLLFCGKLDTGHFDAILPVHEKWKFGIFDNMYLL
jgi:hypothetical protein